jgi:hypothetical protein
MNPPAAVAPIAAVAAVPVAVSGPPTGICSNCQTKR